VTQIDTLMRLCNALPDEVPCSNYEAADMAIPVIESLLDRLASQEERLIRYETALEKLSKLGNGEIPGNSIGNCIAQAALSKEPCSTCGGLNVVMDRVHPTPLTKPCPDCQVKCRKCGGNMKPGQALRNIATCGSLDMGEAVTFSEGTEAELIDCMKCEKCGWSVTVATEESGG